VGWKKRRETHQVHGLSCAHHGDGETEIVADLGHPAAAWSPDMDHVLAHGAQVGFALFEHLRLPSDHKGEGPCGGSSNSSGHLRQQVSKGDGGSRSDGEGVLQEHRSFYGQPAQPQHSTLLRQPGQW
jgi:hypothetical protein